MARNYSKTHKTYKMIRKTLLTIQIVFLVIAIQAQDQKEWGLENCVSFALENNLGLKNQNLTVSMLNNSHMMAKYSRLPGVSANTRFQNQFGQTFNEARLSFVDESRSSFSGSVSANAQLFNGFRYKHDIQKTNYDVEAARADLEVQANDLALNIVNNYLQILYNREQLNAAKIQLEVTNKQIERTEALVSAGSSAKGDVLELIAQSADEKAQITNYMNQERQARINLKQAMNYAGDSISVVNPQNINVDSLYLQLPPINDVYLSALEHLPDLKAAQARIKSSIESIDIAKSEYYPKLDVGASLSTAYDNLFPDPEDPASSYTFFEQAGDFRTATAYVSLSIPIFNKFQVKYNVQNAQINYEMAQTDELIIQQNIYKTIELAHSDAQSAHRSYAAAKESLTASEESFRYAEQRFNAGLINSVDYNLAKSNLSKAEVALLNARYELIFKIKILDFYMGKPLNL
jgi:outer membrane protein